MLTGLRSSERLSRHRREMGCCGESIHDAQQAANRQAQNTNNGLVTQQPRPHTAPYAPYYQQGSIASPPPTHQNVGMSGQNGYQNAQMQQTFQQNLSMMTQAAAQMSTSPPLTSPSPPTTFSDSQNSYANLIRPNPIHAAGSRSIDPSPHMSLANPQITGYAPTARGSSDEGKVVVSIDFGALFGYFQGSSAC